MTEGGKKHWKILIITLINDSNLHDTYYHIHNHYAALTVDFYLAGHHELEFRCNICMVHESIWEWYYVVIAVYS